LRTPVRRLIAWPDQDERTPVLVQIAKAKNEAETPAITAPLTPPRWKRKQAKLLQI
jgi:hypothetical protein